MTVREVHVGQWLGSACRVLRMRHFKTWGWVAYDSTGASYAQRQARHGDQYTHVIVPDGLRQYDVNQRDPSAWVRLPWPKGVGVMTGRWVCANPNCAGQIHHRTVTVTVHDLWNCGDHAERPLTSAFVTCSWACMAAMAHDLAAQEGQPSEVPF